MHVVVYIPSLRCSGIAYSCVIYNWESIIALSSSSVISSQVSREIYIYIYIYIYNMI